MWDFFVKGGVVMIPLGICSVVALVIIIERILFFCRLNRWEEKEIRLIKLYLYQGKVSEAKAVSAKWNSSLGIMVDTALKQWEHNRDLVEQVMESSGMAEIKKFERGLGVLDTIITASPLLGLLGTVTGIIKAFTALSIVGGAQATQLSLGIAEALYTTAFGLAIAIPTLFFVNFSYSFIDKQAQRLTAEGQEILKLLQTVSGEQNEAAS
ncbi:MAG TPA: MotA/TolQ/ExbB proton channel family protein [Bacillota bacterium]|jgi:biopolymer transport protein ExbB|nr:MotA/TolQ/ExbB proton channel family protein [Bacillota bacterium]HOL08703.1 MotA/TolQ/ExbB proton channel family protein [Bacillota bacterium]HPO96394.1 MotA/TolQ/ExbB proton channel family protein [Bacillota bacterium]